MGQILVRNIEDDVVDRLKANARQAGLSLEEVARNALREAAKPSRAELLAELDRIRSMSPFSPVDSTNLIREDRDNDEPYR